MYFRYDSNNELFGINANGTEYVYVKNLQGDVTGIADMSGNIVVQYRYDPWGQVESVTGSLANTLGQLNPMRYRGYYLDAETGYYYLQSRYYEPEMRRFINADDILLAKLTDNNLFSYCGNTPINQIDPTGHIAIVDDMAVLLALGIFLTGYALVAYVSTPTFRYSWNKFCLTIGRAVSGIWNWISSIFTSASKAISNAVSKAKLKIKNNSKKYSYWVAVKVSFNGGKSTYIPTIGISYSKTITYVRSGGDVFANSKNNAKKLARAVGGGMQARDPAHGTLGYWRHYHATRGGKRIGGHIFYV